MLFVWCVLHACIVAAAHAAGAGLKFDDADGVYGYAEYEPWDFSEEGTLSFMFQTYKQEGILLYAENSKNGRQDFMYAYIDGGGITLEINLEFCREQTKLEVDGKFTDNDWYEVSIILGFRKVSIIVDNDLSQSRTERCVEGRLNPTTKLTRMRKRKWGSTYLGGAPVLESHEWAKTGLVYQINSFSGCIGNLMYRRGTQKAYKAKLNDQSYAEFECENACTGSKPHQCEYGKCVDHITTYDCDCTGTGYEGTYCDNASSMVFLNGSGYMAYKMQTPNVDWSMTTNRLRLRLVPKHPDGIILYMGTATDHLVVELVKGKIRVDINLGGGRLILYSKVSLNMSSYHWVELTRLRQLVTLDIRYGRFVYRNTTPGKLTSLDLKGDDRIAYFGGGPGPEYLPLSVSKRNYSGFLQQMEFENVKVLDEIVKKRNDNGFRAIGEVSDGRLFTHLLPDQPSVEGSGPECDETEDDEDNERCKPSATPNLGIHDVPTKSTTRSNTRILTRITYPTPSKGVVMSQREPPPDHSVSPWVIIIIVAAAVVAVLITIFLLYRWNNRYSGSFKPSKGEPEEDDIHPTRGYEQPAFYVSPNKPTKGESIA